MRRLDVGDAKVSIINLGDLCFKLKDIDNEVPEQVWRGSTYSSAFEKTMLYPTQCVHISISNLSVLVDAGNYDLFSSLEPSYSPPNYEPPPSLIEQLAGLGMAPQRITHVIITHAHYDHYSGTTTGGGSRGDYVASFPNAKYLIGGADWASPEVQKALKNPNSPESKSLGVLKKEGLLELVVSEKRLAPELQIIPSPGESLGHQIVRLHSRGDTLYCVGDLFHHAAEVENPSWMASWADRKANQASRLALINAAISERASIVASHMPVGRLERNSSGSGARFVPA